MPIAQSIPMKELAHAMVDPVQPKYVGLYVCQMIRVAPECTLIDRKFTALPLPQPTVEMMGVDDALAVVQAAEQEPAELTGTDVVPLFFCASFPKEGPQAVQWCFRLLSVRGFAITGPDLDMDDLAKSVELTPRAEPHPGMYLCRNKDNRSACSPICRERKDDANKFDCPNPNQAGDHAHVHIVPAVPGESAIGIQEALQALQKAQQP
jgi:hypothetical protein